MKPAVALLSVLAVALLACGPFHRLAGAPAASVAREASPERVASGPRLASPPRSTPAPSPPAGKPVPRTYSNAPCRLPVADISEAKGYFVGFPSGARANAAGSVVALPGGVPGALGQNPGLSYDAPLKRWVPVPRSWLEPSGKNYVYEDFSSGSVYMVTVASGAQRLLAKGNWYILGATDNGVYVGRYNEAGASLISFDSGAITPVAGGTGWAVYGGGALWAIVNSGSVLRHDLGSGVERVFPSGSNWIDTLGFDTDGSLLLKASTDVPSSNSNQPYALKEVRSDGTVVTLWSGTGYSPGTANGDGHGVWFELSDGYTNTARGGIYLWTPRHGAMHVTTFQGNIAGACS